MSSELPHSYSDDLCAPSKEKIAITAHEAERNLKNKNKK